MSKLIAFFMFLFVGCTILSAIMEGGGGVVSTQLTSTIDSDDTTLSVTSTADFEDDGNVMIGSEKIAYTSKTSTTFAGCTRGEDETTARAHASGAMVYTEEASIVNNAMGFDVAATADSMGWWAVVTLPLKFMTTTLPNIIVMNYSFLTGELGIIGWFFFAMGIGLVITIALQLAGGRRI